MRSQQLIQYSYTRSDVTTHKEETRQESRAEEGVFNPSTHSPPDKRFSPCRPNPIYSPLRTETSSMHGFHHTPNDVHNTTTCMSQALTCCGELLRGQRCQSSTLNNGLQCKHKDSSTETGRSHFSIFPTQIHTL